MKKQNLFLVLLSVFLLCLGACGQKESQTGKGMKIVTSFYPIYAMVKEVSGDLNDVRMIQSSSGGPCKKSMPELMELAAKPDRDFEILTVIAPGIQGEKTVEQFPQWFQEQGYKDIPVLYDTKATTFQAYQIRSIPTEYLIDSQGKIGKIQFGAISNADAETAFKEMN
ncbi:thioredoxin [Streptococcus pneumoniae]|nr:thioredoxin [Streptococcus pneumoniae]